MVLTLANLEYNYKNSTIANRGADSLQAWLENSYKVKGFGATDENILTYFVKSNVLFSDICSYSDKTYQRRLIIWNISEYFSL